MRNLLRCYKVMILKAPQQERDLFVKSLCQLCYSREVVVAK
jgi:hypothetical protein